jgi:hypothetical protein
MTDTVPMDSRVAPAADVISAEVDGELVLLNTTSGEYFGLNRVATYIWQAMAEQPTVSEIGAGVQATFDVDASTAFHDLTQLLDQLAESGLVTIGEEGR